MQIVIRGLDQVLQNFDRIETGLKSELQSVLETSLTSIQKEARENHNFTSRSGKTEREIETKIFSFNSSKISGEVYTIYPIGIYQHEGTGIYGPKKKPIWIEPRKKKLLRYVGSDGNWYSSKGLYVKGIKPDPYIYKAAEKLEGEVISRFETVVEKIISR